jgi:NAD(P)-dependent dehydrogenase (short-subunit alcohol dehydrogenase family)
MKILITGHTSGIGKHLYENLDGDIIGASRSNDKPIKKISEWFDESCDVFINNAYDDDNLTAQSDALKYAYHKWKDDESQKRIISIGSVAPDDIIDNDDMTHQEFWKSKAGDRYTEGKLLLDRTNYKCYMKYNKVRCTNIRLGWTDTPRVKYTWNGDKLKVDDVFNVVNFIINFDGRIREITLEYE